MDGAAHDPEKDETERERDPLTHAGSGQRWEDDDTQEVQRREHLRHFPYARIQYQNVRTSGFQAKHLGCRGTKVATFLLAQLFRPDRRPGVGCGQRRRDAIERLSRRAEFSAAGGETGRSYAARLRQQAGLGGVSECGGDTARDGPGRDPEPPLGHPRLLRRDREEPPAGHGLDGGGYRLQDIHCGLIEIARLCSVTILIKLMF